MTIITTQVWPVNENNEIVLEAGTGSSNVVGYVSQDNVAVNTATNKVPVVLVNSRSNLSAAGLSKSFCAIGTGAFSGYTMVLQQPAMGPFYSFQLVYENKTSSAVTITSAKAAVSPTHQNDGSALTWVQVTFNGSNSGVIPSGTLPAGGSGNDWVPGLLLSDPIYLSYTPRTDDVSKMPLIQSRTWFAGALAALQVGGTVIASFNASAAAAGGQWASSSIAADYVTTTPARAPTEAGVFITPVSAKFNYGATTFILACAGDSLTRGEGSTDGVLGWPQRLQGLRASRRQANGTGTILTVANHAWSGQKHTASMQTAKNIISAYKPNAITIYAWSPNDDASSQAVMDKCWAETLELIEFGRQNGCRVIPVTSGPVNSYTPDKDARVKAQNDRVRALGIFYLDVARIIEDPSDRTKILAAYSAGDGTHYSDAGYAAIAAMVDTSLTSIVP